MKLTEVMKGVAVKEWQGGKEAEISTLAYESQKVGQGSLFCTWKGKKSDGHAFVPDALQRGAVAVVAEQKTKETEVPRIRVENGRRALGRMAANFYGNPSKEIRVVGITGTNGKTSTAMLLQSLFEGCGLHCGYMGTVGNDVGKGRQPAKQTTPEALDLQSMLAEMRENGGEFACIGAGSDGRSEFCRCGLHKFGERSFGLSRNDERV
jgi:UDP-N-acetylmuramoyl-L-alanyl-D-glutamate--2,6-diaminopimelate ligase